MTAWHRGVVAAFDTESTGVDPTEARIVTACFLELHPDGQVNERSWLIDPGVEIPEGASAIHGVTTERARAEGQQPAVALAEIAGCLQAAWLAGWPVVGHNVGPYDLTLLDHELVRHDLPGVAERGGPGLVVDTLTLDKALRPRVRGAGARTLTACCEAYKVRIDGAHQAHFDAIAAARIAWRMAEQFPEQVQVPLDVLQIWQAAQHRSWAEEFGAYLSSVGRFDDVEREWPYRPAARQAAVA